MDRKLQMLRRIYYLSDSIENLRNQYRKIARVNKNKNYGT